MERPNSKTDVIHIRVSKRMRELAETRAIESGKNLTEYLTDLIKADAVRSGKII